LEELREEHVEWLTMTDLNLAQQYKDIAAMTALICPFVEEVRKALLGDPSKQRIEVRKAIDRADDPYELMYTVGPLISAADEHNYSNVRVFPRRDADTYFSYDQLLALLKQLPHQPDERTSRFENSIPLTIGDVEAVYVYMRGARYRTEKEWREFAYKLSLAARFPQFYEKRDSDKE
jgi:hypothetical protein